MAIRSLFICLLTATCFSSLHAQDESKFDIYGNARFSYVSSSSDAFDHFDGTSFLRVRIGAKYSFNAANGFRARLATTQSSDFPDAYVTIASDNKGLNRGGISFDEFYYHHKGDKTEIKLGRFQHTVKILTNAGRSHFRFQSNNVNIHWSDGLYLKRQLNDEWYGEVIAEYQPKNHVTFPYKGGLDFKNNDHNLATYLGLENRNRDGHNIIQKGFGMFYAPNAYAKPTGYSYYLGVMSRIALDFPQEALQGGSLRVAGEIGQNLNTAFEDGTSIVASVGVHNFAGKHQLMIEFAKTDPQWLTVNVYAPNADEMEIRYRYLITKKFNIDFRYRIREPRNDLAPTNYNFFARATYSF
jgi:hypothetical protein